MKFTVQLFILAQSLFLINADKQCDGYLAQCNLFKERCSPTSTTVNTCCDMTGMEAPSITPRHLHFVREPCTHIHVVYLARCTAWFRVCKCGKYKYVNI